jgi:hypothetical protein
MKRERRKNVYLTFIMEKRPADGRGPSSGTRSEEKGRVLHFCNRPGRREGYIDRCWRHVSYLDFSDNEEWCIDQSMRSGFDHDG